MNRRQALVTGGWMTALGFSPDLKAAKASGTSLHSKIGTKPFINLTATLTINGGALTLPEVKKAMDEASYYPVNLDDLMGKAGARIAELLGAEAAMVSPGAAAALTLGTVGAITGTDPEKLLRVPDLTGLKNEVIIPRQSRNAYDHAFRTMGTRMVEVDSVDAVTRAVNARTAVIAMLGTGESKGPIKLEHLAEIGKRHKVPVIVDAAAELPLKVNPYLSRGADLVAYSGGKSLRGPQCAGLLLGRKDLIQSAWANSSPHHAFGRNLKVGKEEVLGMLASVEVWSRSYNLESDYAIWKGWFQEIQEKVERVDGVKTKVREPAGASPFPVLDLQWDPQKIGYSAGEIGQLLLEGTPRIMSHAGGEGHGFQIRPVSMRAGDAKVVAKRLEEILKGAPKGKPAKTKAAPAANVAGSWLVDIEFSVGTTRHELALESSGATVSGKHIAKVGTGNVRGSMDGNQVHFRSGVRIEGTTLGYDFKGTVSGNTIQGTVDFGEYGEGKFTARRA
ncbi:MAG: aminotransferase class V-fold PLP-dependent enzyme [Bryobacterales bacterium]|nr:aminotransferase class V-fold PLP-dependent enzyme [Bryobacterales bacterium]